MATECSAERFDFGMVEGRLVEAAFDGGLVTSAAGSLLLGATDRATTPFTPPVSRPAGPGPRREFRQRRAIFRARPDLLRTRCWPSERCRHGRSDNGP
jgi:hypothetical protein